MLIAMREIGIKLDSRPNGREAFLAMQPTIRLLKEDKKLTLDFAGIDLLTPSFADECITPLVLAYGKRVEFGSADANASVRATLSFLAEEWEQGE
jgi:hypothetical protein